jgi:hypothetical protein
MAVPSRPSLSLGTQRFRLTLLAVHIQCLDSDRRAIDGAVATGFVRREDTGLWLYTCWHVVTGLNPNHLELKALPTRRNLRVSFQPGDARKEAVVIGGVDSVDVSLYETRGGRELPRWHQDQRYECNQYLQHAGLYLPFWHDLVKVPLPDGTRISEFQIISDEMVLPAGTEGTMLVPGDRCMVVGYPFGYSARGMERPSPIALTRFVASAFTKGRPTTRLIDLGCAAGMSGGPVFVERGENLYFFGVYGGALWPDHVTHPKPQPTALDHVTSLGTVIDLHLLLHHHLQMVLEPTEAGIAPME